ncbi:MAG: ScyD/ScyE family protein [Motilibacteraceae bacterium]
MRPHRPLVLLAAGAVGAATWAVPVASAGASDGGWTLRTVVSGLNAPRGVAIDSAGAVYVSEAGYPGKGSMGVTRTGGVGKYVWRDGRLHRTWRTSFTSVYASEGGGPPDALGPSGMSALGRDVKMIMGLSQAGVRAEAHRTVPQVGHLYRFDTRTGRAVAVSDVGDQQYAWTAQHKYLWNEFPDSNPYGVLVARDRHGRQHTYVVDAGANTVSEVLANGRTRIISYIPNETPPGTRDAVPTCVAQGPDGKLYVGALDLLVNLQTGGGKSNVWRVDPSSRDWRHNATKWATGLTTISSCAFDRQGNLWLTEMFKDNGTGKQPGDVARIPFAHPTQVTRFGGGLLPFPGAVTVSTHGAVYVTTGATLGKGQGKLWVLSHR